jgi:defect in organelle trafficking protein DotC
MSELRRVLMAAIMLCSLCVVHARAQDSLTSAPVPPNPTPEQFEAGRQDLGNPLNQPITGATEDPLVVGTPPPPSLEALQATRPGDEKGDGLEPGRADALRTAALQYGAQGGLAARSFAINEMLRRYLAQLDSAPWCCPSAAVRP